MKVKVNRIASTQEISILKDIGVDIFGISVDKEKDIDNSIKYDSRANSIEKVLRMKNEIQIPHLSIHINWYFFTEKVLDKVIGQINPDSINIFLPTLSFSNTEELNYNWFKNQIELVNNYKQEVIVFGDGFMYDDGHFNFKKTEVLKINNLKSIELNSFTINSKKNIHIKSKEDWKLFFESIGVDKNINQEEIGDLIKETVTDEIKDLEVLITDKFIDTLEPSELEFWNLNGVTMSIDSKDHDIFINRENGIGLSDIAYQVDFEKIVEITKRIKKHYA